jgi:hypothetical protein
MHMFQLEVCIGLYSGRYSEFNCMITVVLKSNKSLTRFHIRCYFISQYPQRVLAHTEPLCAAHMVPTSSSCGNNSGSS